MCRDRLALGARQEDQPIDDCRDEGTVLDVNRTELAEAISPYRDVPGVDDALTRLLGGRLEDVSDEHLVAAHVVAAESYLGVYLAASSHFALLEATSDGQMFSLFVPNHQIRRIVLLEDPATTRLTLEMNADRSSISGTLDSQGTFTADVRAGGYEIVAMTELDRASLRALQAALVSVV